MRGRGKEEDREESDEGAVEALEEAVREDEAAEVLDGGMREDEVGVEEEEEWAGGSIWLCPKCSRISGTLSEGS